MGALFGFDREQIEMVSLNMQVDEESIARVIDSFVDNVLMRKKEITKAFTVKETGRPKYPDASMMKLYIYGYLKGVRSSRKLAEACRINLEVRWLMNALEPDFRTISDFRKNHIDQIVASFDAFNEVCRKTVVTDDGKTAYEGYKSTDGTKIRASQAKDKVFTANKIDDRVDNAKQRLAQYKGYLNTLDKNDSKEQKVEAAELANLPSRETIEKKIEYYSKHLDDLELIRDKIEDSGEQYSETDPDARLMKNHYGGYTPSYNVQAAVDSNSHMVENFKVTSDPTDHGKLYETLSDLPGVKESVADNGYCQVEDLSKCLENGIIPNVFPNTTVDNDGNKVAGKTIDVSFSYEPAEISEEEKASFDPADISKCLRAGVVPDIYKNCLTEKQGEERFKEKKTFSEFEGNEEIDDLDEEGMKELAATGYFVRDIKADKVYCPQGVILRKKKKAQDGTVRYCNKLQCGKCSNPCYNNSTSSKTKWKEIDFKPGQRKKPVGGTPPKDRAKRKVLSKEQMVVFTFHPDLEKLNKRKCLSEHPFGTIKRYQNGDHFLLRTRAKVMAEAALMFLGYNIKRFCSLVSPAKAITAMQA